MSKLTENVRESAHALEKVHELQERIRVRAHAIWEHRGRPHGDDQAHWSAAEREIAEEEARTAGSKENGKKRREAAADEGGPTTKRRRSKPAAPPADVSTAKEAETA